MTKLSVDEATPRPWKLLESKVPGYRRYLSIVDENNNGVCRITGADSYNPRVLETVHANATLILNSVHAHDALVAERNALKLELEAVRSAVNKLMNSDLICSRCGSSDIARPTVAARDALKEGE
jgi:hypothetical protein